MSACEGILMVTGKVRYRFDGVDVDVSNVRLSVNGEVRALEPKSFRLLQFLIENRGRAVSKEEILTAVWPDSFVTDNALTRAVTQIRKALGDDPKEPRYIETVPTIGYRFLAECDLNPVSAPAAPGAVQPTGKWRWTAVALAVLALLAAGWVTTSRRAPQVPLTLTFSNTSQFSSGDGLEVNATFSPDGNLLAYSSDRSGSFEIYVRSLETGARELQLTSDGNQNMFPTFSPDGRSIAYSSAKQKGIFRLPALGGPIRRLTEMGARPVWSPNGQTIVFESHQKPSLATTDYYWPADTSLWTVSADGGTPRQITSPNNPPGGQTFPSWSSDGNEVRFVNYVGRQPSLWTYHLPDGKLQKRFERPRGSTLGSATFSSDSARMYYVSSQLNGNIGILMLRLNRSTLVPEGEPEPVFQPSLGVPRDLSLAPDGRRIAYSATVAQSKLLVLGMKGDRPDGSAPVSVAHETSYRYSQGKWSPDSRSIVYTRWPKGRMASSWLDKLDGTPPVPIGPGTYPQFFPQFFPDGRSVLMIFAKSPTDKEFAVVSLADGLVHARSVSGGIDQPHLSPDGAEVVFHDGSEPVMHLKKINLKTGQLTQMTSGSTPSGYGHFSRDSKWLSVQVEKPESTGLAVMPSAGGELKVVWNEPGSWFGGGWSPDSDKILVAGWQGDGWALYWVSRTTRKLQKLTDNLPLRMFLRYPEWSPDGKRLLYEFNETKGNVFLGDLQ